MGALLLGQDVTSVAGAKSAALAKLNVDAPARTPDLTPAPTPFNPPAPDPAHALGIIPASARAPVKGADATDLPGTVRKVSPQVAALDNGALMSVFGASSDEQRAEQRSDDLFTKVAAGLTPAPATAGRQASRVQANHEAVAPKNPKGSEKPAPKTTGKVSEALDAPALATPGAPSVALKSAFDAVHKAPAALDKATATMGAIEYATMKLAAAADPGKLALPHDSTSNANQGNMKSAPVSVNAKVVAALTLARISEDYGDHDLYSRILLACINNCDGTRLRVDPSGKQIGNPFLDDVCKTISANPLKVLTLSKLRDQEPSNPHAKIDPVYGMAGRELLPVGGGNESDAQGTSAQTPHPSYEIRLMARPATQSGQPL